MRRGGLPVHRRACTKPPEHPESLIGHHGIRPLRNMNPEEHRILPELIDPKHTALIVIDMQNDYCSRKGALCLQGKDVAMVEPMAPRLARLLTASRNIGLLIIHTP